MLCNIDFIGFYKDIKNVQFKAKLCELLFSNLIQYLNKIKGHEVCSEYLAKRYFVKHF